MTGMTPAGILKVCAPTHPPTHPPSQPARPPALVVPLQRLSAGALAALKVGQRVALPAALAEAGRHPLDLIAVCFQVVLQVCKQGMQ